MGEYCRHYAIRCRTSSEYTAVHTLFLNSQTVYTMYSDINQRMTPIRHAVPTELPFRPKNEGSRNIRWNNSYQIPYSRHWRCTSHISAQQLLDILDPLHLPLLLAHHAQRTRTIKVPEVSKQRPESTVYLPVPATFLGPSLAKQQRKREGRG